MINYNIYFRIFGVFIFLSVMIASSFSFVLADFSKVWDQSSKSVVSVLPTWPGYKKPGFGAPSGTSPQGTGVLISDDGLVITASHVISRATEVQVREISGKVYVAEIIFNDPITDLAVLKTNILNQKIKITKLRPKTGSDVCLISNSFGLGLSMTCGIVSAQQRSGIGFNSLEDFIQIDAAANPGSSGGAVLDKKGDLVGLMSGIFTKETDTNVGVNFAVSSDLILKQVTHLLK